MSRSFKTHLRRFRLSATMACTRPSGRARWVRSAHTSFTSAQVPKEKRLGLAMCAQAIDEVHALHRRHTLCRLVRHCQAPRLRVQQAGANQVENAGGWLQRSAAREAASSARSHMWLSGVLRCSFPDVARPLRSHSPARALATRDTDGCPLTLKPPVRKLLGARAIGCPSGVRLCLRRTLSAKNVARRTAGPGLRPTPQIAHLGFCMLRRSGRRVHP